jgi:hypothetical protein
VTAPWKKQPQRQGLWVSPGQRRAARGRVRSVRPSAGQLDFEQQLASLGVDVPGSGPGSVSEREWHQEKAIEKRTAAHLRGERDEPAETPWWLRGRR